MGQMVTYPQRFGEEEDVPLERVDLLTTAD
jgi:hypothetical protein